MENLSRYVEFDQIKCKYFGSIPGIGESIKFRTHAEALSWVDNQIRRANAKRFRDKNKSLPYLWD